MDVENQYMIAGPLIYPILDTYIIKDQPQKNYFDFCARYSKPVKGKWHKSQKIALISESHASNNYY